MNGRGGSPLAWVLKALIIGYRYSFSAFFGLNCRFRPTCSEYAIEAISTHGALRGAWLAVRRIGRCHPWGGSGWDPVPGTGAVAESPPDGLAPSADGRRHH